MFVSILLFFFIQTVLSVLPSSKSIKPKQINKLLSSFKTNFSVFSISFFTVKEVYKTVLFHHSMSAIFTFERQHLSVANFYLLFFHRLVCYYTPLIYINDQAKQVTAFMKMEYLFILPFFSTSILRSILQACDLKLVYPQCVVMCQQARMRPFTMVIFVAVLRGLQAMFYTSRT